jgi:hypothetical protein
MSQFVAASTKPALGCSLRAQVVHDLRNLVASLEPFSPAPAATVISRTGLRPCRKDYRSTILILIAEFALRRRRKTEEPHADAVIA